MSQYVKNTSKQIDDDDKIGFVSGKICELDLRRHLQLNAVTYTTYASRMAKNPRH